MGFNSLFISNFKKFDLKGLNINFKNFKNSAPCVYVAPNGFGKSTIASLFKLVSKNDFSIKEKNIKNKSTILRINIDGVNYEYDDLRRVNEFHDNFDIKVISTNIGTSIKKIKNKITYADIKINNIKLYDIIDKPKKIFNFAILKAKFKKRSIKELLIDLQNYFLEEDFLNLVHDHFSIFESKLLSKKIISFQEFLFKSDQKEGKIDINKSNIDEIVNLKNVKEFAEKLSRYFAMKNINIHSGIVIYELFNFIEIEAVNKNDINQMKKYAIFLKNEKQSKEILRLFDYSNRCKITSNNNSRIIDFPSYNAISSGERDIVTIVFEIWNFINCYERKKNKILILDYIFDYLDGANLVAFQYSLLKLIDRFKKRADLNAKLFTILFTHLDPAIFNTFPAAFNIEYSIEPNKASLNDKDRAFLFTLEKRETKSFKAELEKYYLHYNPDFFQTNDNFETSFKESFASNYDFYRYLNNVKNDYIKQQKTNNPFALDLFLRIYSEKILYNLCENEVDKIEFLSKNARQKFKFVLSKGLNIPIFVNVFNSFYNRPLHCAGEEQYRTSLNCFFDSNLILKIFLEKELEQNFNI